MDTLLLLLRILTNVKINSTIHTWFILPMFCILCILLTRLEFSEALIEPKKPSDVDESDLRISAPGYAGDAAVLSNGRHRAVTHSVTVNISESQVLFNEAENLERVFEYGVRDNLTGFVQTKGFEHSMKYPQRANWSQGIAVTGPRGHVFFFDVKLADYMPCQLQRIELYPASEQKGSNMLCVTMCTDHLARVGLLLHHVVHVAWRVHNQMDGETLSGSVGGFQLRFCFYKKTAHLPHQLPSGLWNCSVPNWPEFQRHFHCNYDTECLQAEDEMDCPFTGDCQPGQIEAGGKCYAFINPRRPILWLEANVDCRETYGTYLASLNTPQEWKAVTEALQGFPDERLMIGLKGVDPGKPQMYQYELEWADGTVAFYIFNVMDLGDIKSCGRIMSKVGVIVLMSFCTVPEVSYYLCEVEDTDKANSFPVSSRPNQQVLPDSRNQSIPFPYMTCPRGHLTHRFLACDAKSSCFPESYVSSDDLDPPSCAVKLRPLPPSFVCRSGGESVAYSLVCDHRADCVDRSDENFCRFESCSRDRPLQCGTSKQCMSKSMKCNGNLDCVNESDERDCVSAAYSHIRVTVPPPAIVYLSHDEDLRIDRTVFKAKSHEGPCPLGYFQCSENGYCLEMALRCNSVYDCPGREDEVDCMNYICSGFYRCRDSQICLPDSDLCDGRPKCPQFDDDLFCHLDCPTNCSCHGLSFFCFGVFAVHEYPNCRYLDAGDSGLMPEHLVHNTMLIYLSLARCGLSHFGEVSLPNLIHLDLRDNRLHDVTARDFKPLGNLRVLLLAGNPLMTSGLWDTELHSLPRSLRFLDLSRVKLPELHISRSLPNLQRLNLSDTGLDHLREPGFTSLTRLRVLDVRDCPLSHIPRQLFQGLYQLRRVQADSYRVCCKTTLPVDFNANSCRCLMNVLSSCDKLLKNNIHVVFVVVSSIICIVTNMIHVVSKAFLRNDVNGSAFNILLPQLCVSDIMMGIYMAIIGIADHVYENIYQWEDVTWRHSVPCKLAGFLFLLSCEVSSVVVLTITIERLIALCSKHENQCHISSTGIYTTGCACWLCGLVVATVPFLWNQGEVFSASGLCIPVPFTTASQGYFHNVTVVFLGVLHVLVFVIQVVIYLRTRPNNLTILAMEQPSLEAGVARTFLPVAWSRCVCWISLAAAGWALCQRGSTCSGGMETVGVVALPLGSVLQPIMYSYGLWQERQLTMRQERVRQFIVAKKKARAFCGGSTDGNQSK